MYDPMWLLRQSAWAMWGAPAHAALVNGLISAFVLASYAPSEVSVSGVAVKESQDEGSEEPSVEDEAVETGEEAKAEPEPVEEPEQAPVQDEPSKGFVFEDVSYEVENVENTDGEQHYMVPGLELSAKVTNTSDEGRSKDDLPMLQYADKLVAFSVDSDFGAGETKDVALSVVFDRDPEQCTFGFSQAENKPVHSGLEGVGEGLTEQFVEALGHLPEDQAALEADVQAEEEKKAQEEIEQAVQAEPEPVEEQLDAEQANEVTESEPEEESPMCWITSSGEKYHLDPTCRYVRGNELKKISVAEATEMGRTACRGCNH